MKAFAVIQAPRRSGTAGGGGTAMPPVAGVAHIGLARTAIDDRRATPIDHHGRRAR